MNTPSAKWFAAIPLEDRIKKLNKQHYSATPSKRQTNQYDQARVYLEDWRGQAPFNENGYFVQRLDLLGVTESELIEVLSSSLASLSDQYDAVPAWLQKLEDVFASYNSEEWLEEHNFTISENPVMGFLTIVARFIQDATHRFNEGIDVLIQNHLEVPFTQKTASQLFLNSLHQGLLEIVKRAMTLELRLAKKTNRLDGETSEDRFMSFIELIAQADYAWDILGSYPVMVEQVVTFIDLWLETRLEFLRRLCNDYRELQITFAVEGSPLGELVAVEGELSDFHRGGQTVMIAKFSSGTKIVYKPKSLYVDSRFQELLAWFNGTQDTISFRLTKLLTYETYGWCEYFEMSSCESEHAIQAFYTRMGAYLAILYSLKATDFHTENIIAFGEHPILIDLETLFHNYSAESGFDGSLRQVGDRLRSSVQTTLMLPERSWGNADGVAVDVSGLGAIHTQLTSIRNLVWEHEGTDEMHYRYDFINYKQEVKSRPQLHGKDVQVSDYAALFEQGFITFYRLIEHHRDAYLELVTNLFHGAAIRCLVRPTQLYYLLKRECYNPKFQRDSLNQTKLLDKLWGQVKGNHKLVEVIPSEQKDIRQGDFPIFTTLTNSCHLWDSRGHKIPDFFNETGMQLAQKVIHRFGDEDLQEQLWLIRTSMASMVKPVKKPLFNGESKTSDIKERLLKTACDLVDQHLQPLATCQGDDLAWLVFRADPRRGWSVTQADMNLYDGVNGIALFLAYLGHVTGESEYTSLAERSVCALHSQMQHNLQRYELIGAFEGWGSVIYGLTHLGVLWDRTDLLAEAAEIARIIPDLIQKDNCLDILAGAAGCIASLLNLHEVCPRPEFLEIAQACGEHLLNKTTEMSVGIGWKNHITKEAPFSGFSHGGAGIAWSLLRLASVTGDGRFHHAAVEAIAYERSLFLPQAGNWQDLRNMSDLSAENQCAMAWCHGAPGIGLGRLLSLPYLNDPLVLGEIDVAIQTIRNHGFGSFHPGFGQNYSLCHGDLGNLDIMLETSMQLDAYAHLKPEIYGWAAIILDSMAEHGWLCGVPHGLLTPGLMTGIAGIGYGLLRLAAPGQVPSVLALEAPMSSHTYLTPRPGKESFLSPI